MDDKIRSVVRYIINEAITNPDESIRDMANESFERYDIPLVAKWTDSMREPIELYHYQGE